MVELAAQIYRDFATDGDPGSGPHKPDKAEIREWGTDAEDRLGDVETDIAGLGTTYLPLAGGILTGLLTTNGQVKFPATQNPSADANTLDDYEEGTWTPSLSATGATFSYASRVGTYTKIGDRVIIDFRVELNTSGNTLAANSLSVTGFPFANGNSVASQTAIRWTASTASYVIMFGSMAAAASTMSVVGLTAAAVSIAAITASNALHATNGSVIQGSGFHYKV
jgi:hypothetical protein